MAVQVENVSLAKSGKCYNVTLSGTKYLANLDSGLNANVGKWIEAEIKPSNDTRFPAWIGKWTHSSAAPQVPPPSASPSPSSLPAVAAPHYAEPSDNIAPWYWPSVSNICATAITAGIIRAPEELNMWALKWAQVCVATKEQVK